NPTSTFFQIPDVLILGLADSAKCRAKTDTHAMLRFLARILEARIVKRQLRRCDRELRIAVEPFQAVRCKEYFRIPVMNLAGATHAKGAWVEAPDAANAALL